MVAEDSDADDFVDTWVLSPADVAVFPVGQANLGTQTGSGAKRPKDRLWGACDFGDFILPLRAQSSSSVTDLMGDLRRLCMEGGTTQ